MQNWVSDLHRFARGSVAPPCQISQKRDRSLNLRVAVINTIVAPSILILESATGRVSGSWGLGAIGYRVIYIYIYTIVLDCNVRCLKKQNKAACFSL